MNKAELRKSVIEALTKKLGKKGKADFFTLEKKFDVILEKLSERMSTQLLTKVSPNVVVDNLKAVMKEVMAENAKELIKAQPKEMTVHLSSKKPEWFKDAPSEVTIKNKEFIVSTNLKQRKEDVSILTTLLASFMESLVSFFTKLQKLTYTVRMTPQHYGTPQAVIIIDPKTMKSMDLKDIGIGTIQNTIMQSTAGRAPSDVGIKGANTFGDGQATVVTAGTRVQLPALPVSRVKIQAHPDNTGDMVVGGANVIADSATRRGLALFSSQWAEFSINDLSKIYIDSTASGDKINYIYEYIS